MDRSRPYRIAFWGPGHVGGTALKLAHGRPEFEIVGALVFNPDKHGKDIGELLGIGNIGVKATTSKQAFLELDVDAVLHAPQPAIDEGEMVEDVAALLESGKNVISVTSFFYPHMRGDAVVQRLEAACVAGGTSLHGTGIHPSFMLERLAPTLSSLVTDVNHIQLTEVVDCEHMLAVSPIARDIVGWGFKPEDINASSLGGMIPDRMYRDSIGYLGQLLYGATPDQIRIDRDYRCITADEDQEIGGLPIAKGNALTVIHHHEGWIGDHKFCTTQELWYLGSANHPFPDMPTGSNYIIEIDGSPAHLRLQMDATSVASDSTPVTTYITAAPLLQSVIPVCKAEPGIVYQRPSPHWASDLTQVGPMQSGLA